MVVKIPIQLLLKLLKEEYLFDLIDITDFVGDKKNRLERNVLFINNRFFNLFSFFDQYA